MTASDEPDPPPFLVLEIGCDCCAGAFVAAGSLATILRGLPAVWVLTSGTIADVHRIHATQRAAR